MRPASILILIAACGFALPATAGPAEDQYTVAAGQYKRQRWQLAIDEFALFLKDYPGHAKAAEARFFTGEALMQLGKVAQAREHFDAFAAAAPDHKYAPQALFRRGECAYLTGDYEPARALLKQFHKDHVGSSLNQYALPYLGDLALMQGDGPAAQAHYTEALREHGETALADQCRYGLARSLQSQRRFDDAGRFYQSIIDKPSSPLADDSLLQLGRMQYERGQFDDAILTLQQLQTKFPESELQPYAKFWTGVTHSGQEDFTAAIVMLEQAAKVPADHPLTPAIAFHLGDAQRRSGRADEAASNFQAVLDEATNSSWADDAAHGMLRLASDADAHDEVIRAGAAFASAHPDSPLNYDARRLHGRAQMKLEQYAEAIATLSGLLTELEAINAQGVNQPAGKISREEARTLTDSTRYLLGLAYVGAEQFASASAVVSAMKPDEQTQPQVAASVSAVQSAALMGQKKYGEAIAPLRNYLRLAPDGPDANKNRAHLAVALAATDQLEEAQRIYDDLAKKHTDRNEFLETTHFLAESAFEAGEKAWARDLFTALADESNPAEFREKGLAGKAWCELDLQAPQRSAETFDRLLKDFPESSLVSQAALARATALDRINKPNEALAMYELVINEHSDSKQLPEAIFRAAKLHDNLQQDKQAEALMRRYVSEFPNQPNIDHALYILAWVLIDQRREADATEFFSRIHQQHKESRYWADATLRLATEASRGGDYAQAAALVDQIIATGTKEDVLGYALFQKGIAAVKANRWADVAGPMEQMLAAFPNSPQATWAKFYVAESYYRQRNYEAAAEQFARLDRDVEGQSETWLGVVPLRRGDLLARNKQWAAAYAMLENIEEDFPGFNQQYEVDYLMGRCLANQARFQEARDAYGRAVANVHGRRTETAAKAQWNIGETYFHQKNYEEAIRAFSRVELLYDYPHWQASSLLEAGKCYEMLGKWSDAQDSYQRILNDFAETALTQEAQRRLQVATERAAAAQRAAARNSTQNDSR